MRLEPVQRLDAGQSVRFLQRAFLSVLPDGSGGYEGVVREFDPTRALQHTDLYAVRLDAEGTALAHRRLGDGEDPRFFRHAGKPYVLTCLTDYRDDWTVWLIDVTSGGRRQLPPPPGTYCGKNWVPVVGGGRLLIVRSLEPLSVLAVDEVTGTCEPLYGDVANRDIGPHRGGGVAYLSGDTIEGFGHFTHGLDRHTAFRYRIDTRDWSVAFEDVEVPGFEGAGIIDPTSAWEGHVVICATSKRWDRPQPVTHAVTRVVL